MPFIDVFNKNERRKTLLVLIGGEFLSIQRWPKN